MAEPAAETMGAGANRLFKHISGGGQAPSQMSHAVQSAWRQTDARGAPTCSLYIAGVSCTCAQSPTMSVSRPQHPAADPPCCRSFLQQRCCVLDQASAACGCCSKQGSAPNLNRRTRHIQQLAMVYCCARALRMCFSVAGCVMSTLTRARSGGTTASYCGDSPRTVVTVMCHLSDVHDLLLQDIAGCWVAERSYRDTEY